MGTTHKSWKISTPVARRPWGASISPLSVSPLRTMAVQEHGHPPAEMQRHGERAAEHHREADLGSAPGDDLPSHLSQPAQGELDADGKEQQDDADFREALHLVRVGDQAERVGAE